MKPSTLFGISAAISGVTTAAVTSLGTTSAVSNVSSAIPATSQYASLNATELLTLKHATDKVFISFGDTETCNDSFFSDEIRLFYNRCYPVDNWPEVKGISTSLRARMVAPSYMDHQPLDECVLATFSDYSCTEDGKIIADLSESVFHSDPGCVSANELDENFDSFKWICSSMIDEDWKTLGQPDDKTISARSVDAELSRDHVTVAPADGPNCNSAQHRDTDTKVQGHCHSFDKPFSSLSATIKRADHSKVGGSEPCSVLVFSDNKCKKDGAEIVDLNNTAALGVCHNVTLHHGNDLVTPIAGHSWKWVCGRQQISECINGAIDSGSDTDTDTDDETTTTVKKGKTFTVTATTSLACSLTTEAAHSVDVVTSVITHKPVTHTITSVFTKTQLRVRTKLITSVATAVSTVHHTLTKPFSTTYKVCDAEASRQS
ncbi:hypothetical protein KCU61_g1773, partial [Aureobasidium melanogenum]